MTDDDMTVAEFDKARNRGDLPLVTFACHDGEHATCRNRVLDYRWVPHPCGCLCHVQEPVGAALTEYFDEQNAAADVEDLRRVAAEDALTGPM